MTTGDELPDEIKFPTIHKTHPNLWGQLVIYGIMPSCQVLEDLRVILEMAAGSEPPDCEITHEVLLALRRNQIIRVKARKAKFLKENPPVVSLPVIKKPDMQIVLSDKPTPPPMWQKVEVKDATGS